MLLAVIVIAIAIAAGAPVRPARAQTACTPFEGRWVLHPGYIAPDGASPELDIGKGIIKRSDGGSSIGGQCTHASGIAVLMPKGDAALSLNIKDDEPDKLETVDGGGSVYYQRR